jgi:hypothetical protein
VLAIPVHFGHSALVQVRLTRDDVAAGDDPEERVLEVDERQSLSQFLTSTGRTYLPTIHGGHATWIVRQGRRGKAIAVFAQEWGRAEMIGSASDSLAAMHDLHFDYRAQADAGVTLDELRSRP